MKTRPDYRKIKETTRGLMEKGNYRDLYEAALALEKGAVVEIGPARGGTTVTLGLASLQNPNIERIISIDAFQNSRCLRYFDDVEKNIEELKNNLAAFGCGEKVTVMVAGQEDWTLLRQLKLSMLVIDADGALDRDFFHYYNALRPGATVFVDDCEARLNKHACLYYTRERTGPSDDVTADAGSYLDKPSPLGKQYMTRCFIDYMVREGFLEKQALRGETITLKKGPSAPEFTEKNLEEMGRIRERMKEKLLTMRRETMRIADRLRPLLREIRDAGACSDVVLLKGVPMNGDIRYYPIYGAGKDGKRAADIERIYEKEIPGQKEKGLEIILLKAGRFLKKDSFALVLRGREAAAPFQLPGDQKKRLTKAVEIVERETKRYLDTVELPSLL